MVPREIDLEENWVYVPTQMIQELVFFPRVVPTPAVEPIVVPEPVASSPVQTMSENQELVLQDPIEPIIAQEEPEQSPEPEVSAIEAPRRSQRVRKSPVPYNSEEVHIDGDPSSFEEVMSCPDASKWKEAMEDEMRSMSNNKVWDLEEIPKGAKLVGFKWVYKVKYDSEGNIEKYKGRLVAKGFTQKRRDRLQ
jgi:hypothetical protein